MTKIQKRVVDAAQPSDKRYFIWDREIKGFGLLVIPTGVKSYVYQYRTPEGRTRRATIGKHGGDWTAEQARAKAE
ncbi:MAG TPA: Arm DNA-binding domain-containing protein, partial [Terriglobia bacterium]|nr:Arm DNA-binding domain-containing protein [Terriglobia bacterium]